LNRLVTSPRPVPPRQWPADGTLVTLAGIAVDVQRIPVLRGLDLAVTAGEAVGVSGANGSGKSTLLHVLATLLRPSAGRGRVLGAELGTRACMAVRPRIALVGHSPGLHPQLTLGENLHFLARLTGRTTRCADVALDQVGLARVADRRAAGCSQGMLRRAELARVLLTEPSLLLLDEAHTGLDPTAAALVDHVVDRVRRDGGAAVVVSHEPARLVTTDRLVEVVDGRAIAVGRCDP